ncbi:hypothetical protein QBC38DRAFT_4404 [Podospora fimiseda]|uniref:Uncharacterized protein n=1 Tax=Podospora fimiseda TaxID=252190 RepID=A0AAN7H8M9_9PEZI|nr:hypothetical protein QBC38DRAFT_4404 [Podospora fimiseda]
MVELGKLDHVFAGCLPYHVINVMAQLELGASDSISTHNSHTFNVIPVYLYEYGSNTIPTSLQITLKKPSDFEAVLSELRKLDIRIAYEHLNPQNISSSNLSSSGFPPEFDRNQFSMSRQIHNISPAPTASTSSQDQHFSHSGFEMDGYAIERPSNQSARLLDRQYWSPVVAPSKSTATIGNPGVLGEPGLYKISRVGSSSSSRLRARPPSIPLEQPRLRTYAPADQLHRILERREPFLPRRQTNETAFGQADQLSPEFGQTDHQLRTQNQMLPPRRFSRIPNLGGAFESTRRPAMQRLDPILDEPETASGYTQLNEQNMDHGFSQPLSAPQNLPLVRREVGDLYHSQLEPSSRETRQAPDTLQLMQISQIHHQGFVKAHGVWTDFMERAENATKSIDNPEEALKIISKLEEEFTEQWDRAVASTIQEMQKVGALK